MAKTFQDCSLIQDFEADFSQKVSLKKLNEADYKYQFSQSVDHLNN